MYQIIIMKYKCLYCNKESIQGKNCFGKYCDSKCQAGHEYTRYISNWKRGLVSGATSRNEVSKHVRKYLLDKFKRACIKCGWNKSHPVDGNALVHINHIDGNSSNCLESNLEVICPNCHSETPNYGRRNKVSSRPPKYSSRGKPKTAT